jgi:sugar/nucleoside kinase (ribokinase family)
MSSRILAIGNAYFEIDSLHYPIDKVSLNHETSGGMYELYPGGSAINFIRICKQLGFETSFIGKTGDDLTGEAVDKMLKSEGIEFLPIVSSSVQTNLALNFVSDNGDQYLFVAGTAAQSLEIHELENHLKSSLPGVDYFYLGGIFKFKKLIPGLCELVNLAKSKESKVVLDHNRITNAITDEDKAKMREVIPLVEYYLPSKDELIELYGVASLDEAIEMLVKERSGITVIKDAENGAIGIRDGQQIKVAAFSVTVHNTVGAGDSFNAGFIRAQTDGLSLEKSIKFACATAALKISQKDLPTHEQVVTLMNS